MARAAATVADHSVKYGGAPLMPRLSLVAVVHREQAYLEAFAASLFAQDAAGWELVAVDSAAVGHAPRILEDLAGRDGRVRVLRLDEHAGVGPARAAGIEAAQGGHVWCVRPTDLLAPGAKLFMTVRKGPVPAGRRMFAVPINPLALEAQSLGLTLLRRYDFPDMLGRKDVSWTMLAFGTGNRV